MDDREIELKLQIAAEDMARLRRNPALRAMTDGRPVTRRLRSVYFDTPRLQLWKKRVTLRLRQIGKRQVQTIKANGVGRVGVTDRNEWETDVNGDSPDLAAACEPLVAELLQKSKVKRRIAPAFETDIRRTTRQLKAPGGGRIELAIDVGEIRRGDSWLSISEAELELKRGRPGQLYDVARMLNDVVPVRIGAASKAERGFSMLTGQPPRPSRASPLVLDPAMSTDDAFHDVVCACVDHLMRNEAPFVQARDPDGVHQMRVALRRLRTACSVSGDLVASPETEAIEDEARWLSGALGLARDLDVFVDGVLAGVLAAKGKDKRLLALRDAAIALRDASRREALHAIGSPRYTAFLLRLGAWAADRRWRREGDNAQQALLAAPVTEAARRMLERRYRKLARLGRRIEDLDEADRHRLRICVKKLRYAGAFFASLYAKKPTTAFLTQLSVLQDSLGALSDGVVARAVMEQIVENPPANGREKDLQWAVGMVTGWHDRQANKKWSKVARQWQSLRKQPKFWR